MLGIILLVLLSFYLSRSSFITITTISFVYGFFIAFSCLLYPFLIAPRSLVAPLSLLLLSLLFPYYSLVAHNISLVALYLLSFYYRSLYFVLSFALLLRSSLSFTYSYRSSLCSSLLIGFILIYRSFIAHFIRSSLILYYSLYLIIR